MNKQLQFQIKERGLSSLADRDLLSILFRSNKSDNANKVLTGSSYNLHELAKMSISQIAAMGVQESEATYVVASFELGRRRSSQDELQKDQIRGSKDAAALMQPIIGDLDHEEIWILFLNRQNKLQAKMRLSEGGMTGTVLDIRRVIKAGLSHNATSLIAVHNHPSGNLEPSDADRRITRQLKDACALMEMPLVDHMIITQTGFFSFADEGML